MATSAPNPGGTTSAAKRGGRPREPHRPKELHRCTGNVHHMSNPAPAFQFYARDWYTATATLSLRAQGAIVRLLCFEWSEGPFRTDPATLQRILNEPCEPELWRAITDWFPELPERPGYHANLDLEAKRREAEEYRERQRQLGVLGAKKRWPRRH